MSEKASISSQVLHALEDEDARARYEFDRSGASEQAADFLIQQLSDGPHRHAAHRYLTITNNLNHKNWTAHKKAQPTNASMGPSPVWGLMASASVISSGSSARVTMYCVGVKDAL